MSDSEELCPICPSAATFVLSKQDDHASWTLKTSQAKRDMINFRKKFEEQNANLLKAQKELFSANFKILVMDVLGVMKTKAFEELQSWTSDQIPLFTAGTGCHVGPFVQNAYDKCMINVNLIINDNITLLKWDEEMTMEENEGWVEDSYSCKTHRTFHDYLHDDIKRAVAVFKREIDKAKDDFLLLDNDFLAKYQHKWYFTEYQQKLGKRKCEELVTGLGCSHNK